MSKPLVAIVGRPNVGKSTFFNRIVGQRISIVEDTPGVTRDRLYADAEWCGHSFTLIDTGGLEIKSEDVMWSHIRAQAQIAVETADVIGTYVYREGLQNQSYSYSTAVGLFTSVLAMVMVLGSNAICKRLGQEGIW